MRTLSILVATCSVSSIAVAEPGTSVPPMRAERVGLELGAGLHAGNITCESQDGYCDGFTEAGGVSLNAAYFTSESFGLTADFWVMAHSQDNFTFAHYVNTLGVKWRPVPILTLQGGIGAAHASVEYEGRFVTAREQSENAFAIMLGASLDLIHAGDWALAVEARFGSGFYGDQNEDDMADIVGRNAGVGAQLTYFGF